MIVRHYRHARPPDDVEDRQIGGAVKCLDLRAMRRGDRFQHGIGVRDRPGYDFTDGLHGGSFTYDSAAVGFELVQIKQGPNLLRSARRGVHIALHNRSSAITYWDRERERRTRTELALHPDPSTMQLDELPAEGQPKARSLSLLVRRPDLAELLED